MEDLFSTRLPEGERPDLQLCIFPHLKEFLAIDLRQEPARIWLLNTEDVFVEEFFRNVEERFSEAVREESEFPFAHLINLPLAVEAAVRETVMNFILDRLGVHEDDASEVPTVVVFIVTDGALGNLSERVLDGLKGLVRTHCGEPAAAEWEGALSRLVAEENAVVQKVQRLELSEAVRGDSPDYFTLWESRN